MEPELIKKSKKTIKRRKYILIALIACLFLVIAAIKLPNSFSALSRVDSVEINSNDYSDKGSWHIDKSAKWTGQGKAQVTFDVTSISQISNIKYKDIIFVLDVSGSMTGTKLQRVKDDVTELVQSLVSPGGNRVAIITFDTQSTILSQFSDDKETLIEVINSIEGDGWTNYNSGLKSVNELMKNYQKSNDRDVIMLFFSDGYPNKESPNQVASYGILKDNYPYMTINAIQYEMGQEILKQIKEVSDYQWLATQKSMDNFLYDIANSQSEEIYEKFEVVDYINHELFYIRDINDVEVTKGKVRIEEEGGVQKVIWTIDNYLTGTMAKMNINLFVKDGITEEFYPTNEKEIITSKLPTKNEQIVESELTPVLFLDKKNVIYDVNTPSGCYAENIDSERHYIYDSVTVRNDKVTCENWLFKGFEIVNDVEMINDNTFIMPEEDVIIRGIWGKPSLTKSMDGTIHEQITIVDLPEAITGFIYNGTNQNVQFNIPENAEVVTSSSTLSATNVGTYSIVFRLLDNVSSEWSDGTRDDKIINWEIKPISIESANVTGLEAKQYIGNPITQIPTVNMVISGENITLVENVDYTYNITNNTNAGNANVIITGIGNYTGTKTVQFEIEKVTPTVTVNPTSVTIVKGGTVTFTEMASVYGTFENTSNATNIATVTPANNENVGVNVNKTETVTGVNDGTATITVKFKPNDSTNYEEVIKTVTVNVTKSAAIPTNSLCKAKANATYTGSAITLTTATSGTGYTLSGYSQTNANESGYTITATLASGYRWSDNTTGTKTFKCSLYKATPTITLSATSGTVVAGKTLTFNEKANVKGKFTVASNATGVATVAQASGNEIAANTNNLVTVTAKASGSATITVNFTPTDTTNYNNATAKTYTATVTKSAAIPTNSLCVARTYTGSAQQLTSVTSGTGYTLSGYSQTNANTSGYTITATLTSGYRWSDNATGTKTFKCPMAKATPTITLSATSGTVVAGKTLTFNEKANVKGKFTVASNATGVATVAQASGNEIAANTNNLVTVTAKASGSATITVNFTPTDTANYNNATAKTYTATVKKSGASFTTRFNDTVLDWCHAGDWGANSSFVMRVTPNMAGVFTFSIVSGTVNGLITTPCTSEANRETCYLSIISGTGVARITFTPTDTSYASVYKDITVKEMDDCY